MTPKIVHPKIGIQAVVAAAAKAVPASIAAATITDLATEVAIPVNNPTIEGISLPQSVNDNIETVFFK